MKGILKSTKQFIVRTHRDEMGVQFVEFSLSVIAFLMTTFVCLNIVRIAHNYSLLQSVANKAASCGARVEVPAGEFRFNAGRVPEFARLQASWESDMCFEPAADTAAEIYTTGEGTALGGVLGYALLTASRLGLLKSENSSFEVAVTDGSNVNNGAAVPDDEDRRPGWCQYLVKFNSQTKTYEAERIITDDIATCTGGMGGVFVIEVKMNVYMFGMIRAWFGLDEVDAGAANSLLNMEISAVSLARSEPQLN